jgi:hypothetical protein
MPRIRLTKSAIDALPTSKSDVVYWDAALRHGYTLTPQHTLTICSDFLVTDRAMGACYRLPLQTPNRRVRWQATSDDENS